MKFASQAAYAVRFEWGTQGIQQVADQSGVVVIVDVLSFSTCVDIACHRYAQVLPYRYKDETAEIFATANNALLANRRSEGGFSLSPQSLCNIERGTRLVLPSPNGSLLSLDCSARIVLAGCLRNAKAVAAYAESQSSSVTVVAAGEKWGNGDLRPALEDLLGAGAIIHSLQASKSPEAQVAQAAFLGIREQLSTVVGSCASAIELSERGFAADVQLAAELDVSSCVPRLFKGAYMRVDDVSAALMGV